MERIEITNDDDFIGVDDLRKRIAHLSKLREPGPVDLGNPEDNETAQDDLFAELATLEDIAASCEHCGNSATLIRATKFEDYARETAVDIGAIQSPDAWPATCIDWEKAANEMRQDYKSVDFNGVEYLVRA